MTTTPMTKDEFLEELRAIVNDPFMSDDVREILAEGKEKAEQCRRFDPVLADKMEHLLEVLQPTFNAIKDIEDYARTRLERAGE